MRVVCVWVDRVVVIVVMVVVMIVIVVMMMVVRCHKAAHARTKRVAVFAIGHVGTGGRCALAFDVVVVRFLNCADF